LDFLRIIFLPHLFPRDFLTRVRGQWALPKSFGQLRGCKVSADEAGRGGKYVFCIIKAIFGFFTHKFLPHLFPRDFLIRAGAVLY
jgi:hypothetical protein